MALARDGCVVNTPPLASMIKDFVRRWDLQRPPNGGTYSAGRLRRPRSEFYGAYDFLSDQSGVPRETVEQVGRGRNRTTELRIAEALVVHGLDRPEAFRDGTLKIEPNRLATKAARAACCSGSGSGRLH